MIKIVLDTKPLIKLFAGEEGWKEVKEIILSAEIGKIEAGICTITLTEIYYKYLQEKRLDLAKMRTEQLKYAIYLKKYKIDEEVAVMAGEFKGKYSIPIADALIAACAYIEKAIIVSDDIDFRKINEIEVLTEKEAYTMIRESI
ncbi:MAG: PIN domain-containing protein [Nitrososphaeria archaeon]